MLQLPGLAKYPNPSREEKPPHDLNGSHPDTPVSQTSHEDILPPNPLPEPPTNPLTKALSIVSRTPTIDPGPPPDGGAHAWTQAFMAHLVIFTTWGYITSFGVFQTYYVHTLSHPPSDISWVGSVQIFLLFFIGTFSGRAMDAGLFRPTFLLGVAISMLGVFTTSFCTRYWQLFLAQGLCTGFGNGLLFFPTMSLLATYFTTRRAVAIAIAASGSATGGMVFPGLVEALLPRIGFGWTIRVLGFVMLALQGVALAFLRTRLPPRKTGPVVEWGAFREGPYALFAAGMFFIFWGLYFAFYYISSFGRDIIHVSSADSTSFLIMANGIGLIGRLMPAYISDRYYGPLNTIIPFSFITSLLLYCWIAVTNRGGLIAFSIIYGLSAAGIQSLFPAILASLTTDMKKVGVRTGMVFSVVAFGVLTGPPLAGALITRDDGNYLYAQVFAGTVLAVGGVLLVLARLAAIGLRIERC